MLNHSCFFPQLPAGSVKYPEGPNSHLDSFREEPWGSAEDVMFEQRSEVIRARQSWSEAVSLFPISPVMRQEGEVSVCSAPSGEALSNCESGGALRGASYPMQVFTGDLV